MSKELSHWGTAPEFKRSPLLCLLLLVVLVGCGSASEPRLRSATEQLSLSQIDPEQRIPDISLHEAALKSGELLPVNWRVVSTHGLREIVIESTRGYCVNSEAPPKYEGVSVREEHMNVYIVAFVGRPPPTEANVCRGVGYAQVGTVKIEQDITSEVKLFDALSTPPKQRWPRE